MSSTAIRSKIAGLIDRRKAAAKDTLGLAKGITKNRENRVEWSKEVKTLRQDLRKAVKTERVDAKKEAAAKKSAKSKS